MDFPLFHMDLLNNRFLIGIIAALHVLINHTMAVGGIAFVVAMEWYGWLKRDARWDRLAYRIMTIFFIITTSLGALTGVGIWFAAALVNPKAIGSLIRVFFSAWFVEWIIFVAEVVLIMCYYLSWKKFSRENKHQHILFGLALAVASWLTMVIITAIIGFMMDPGSWPVKKTFISGFFNPVYLPQLVFRTSLAMMIAASAGLGLALVMTRNDLRLRKQTARFVGIWMLLWTPVAFLGCAWYAYAIPDNMVANLAVANTTTRFVQWFDTLQLLIIAVLVTILLLALWAAINPQHYPRIAYVMPIVFLAALICHFERVREFIRKPYVIGDYMYANSIRYQDYPLLQQDGLLKYATYASSKKITAENAVHVGQEVFMLSCSRCHTLYGINSIKDNFTAMYGNKPWQQQAAYQYIGAMHHSRPFMPPFPGNSEERRALAQFLVHLQKNRVVVHRAQVAGAIRN